MATMNFNAAEIPPLSHDPIPTGIYEAWIIGAESRATRAGNGRGYKFRFEIISGPHKGRTFYDWITVEHENKKTQEMGQRTLSALCHAVNVLNPADTSDLHGIPIKVALGLDPKDPTRNRVRNVWAGK